MGETLVTELMAEAAARQEARRLALSEFRPRRAPAALCAALVVTAAGGWTAAEVFSRLAGTPPAVSPVTRYDPELHRLTWHDPLVMTVAAAMVALGLWLLVAAVVPGRTRMEPLRSPDPRLAAAISRTALRRALAATTLSVPGITRAQVRLTVRLRRRVVVRATTHYRNPANLAELIRMAVTARQERLDPLYRRRVIVRLSWRKD